MSRTVWLARPDQAAGDEHVGSATIENLRGLPAQGRAHRADCTTGPGLGPAQTVPAPRRRDDGQLGSRAFCPASPMPSWLRSGHRVQRHVERWTGPCGLGSTRATTQIAPEPVRAMDAQPAGLRSLREHPDHHTEREPGPCAHAQAAARIPWPYVKHEALRSSSSSRLLKEDLTFG